jgi:hypothetical protein
MREARVPEGAYIYCDCQTPHGASIEPSTVSITIGNKGPLWDIEIYAWETPEEGAYTCHTLLSETVPVDVPDGGLHVGDVIRTACRYIAENLCTG